MYLWHAAIRAFLAALFIWALGIIVPQHPVFGQLLVLTEGFRAFPALFILTMGVALPIVLYFGRHVCPRWCVAASVCAVVALTMQIARAPALFRNPWRRSGPSSAELTVAIANVEFGRANGKQLLEILRTRMPTVLVVTEITEPWIRLSTIREHYPYRFELPGKWAEGTAVYSTRELVNAVAIDTHGMFAAISASLGDDAIHPIHLIALHAPPPQGDLSLSRRTEYLRIVAELVGKFPPEDPVVVAGDFNTTPFSEGFQTFLSTAMLTDAASDSFLPATWGNRFFGAFLDHVLIRGLSADETFTVLPPFGSDHFPVVATLRRRNGSS